MNGYVTSYVFGQPTEALFNAIDFSSNAGGYGSNMGNINQDTAIYGSNQANNANNKAIFGSNLSVWNSNMIITNSNDLYPRYNNTSNLAYWSSNALINTSNDLYPRYLNTSNLASANSNLIRVNSNDLYPRYNNTSNLAFWTSNALISTSNDLYPRYINTSNLASWTSNALIANSNLLHPKINETSNYVYNLSNTVIQNSNQSYPGIAFASNLSVWDSNQITSLSNIVFPIITWNSNEFISSSNDIYSKLIASGWYTQSNMAITKCNVRIDSNLEVVGNLTVRGTTTTVDSTTVNIVDNIIRLNNGASFNSSLQAGIEVNRGTGYSNYLFVFDEASDMFEIGMNGQLQVVATRDDNPNANSIAFFDSTRFKYTGCNDLVYNAGRLGVGKSNPAYKLDVNGDINFTGSLMKGGSLWNPSLGWEVGNGGVYTSSNIGIGTYPTGYKLDVAGSCSLTSLQTNQIFSTLASLNIGSEHELVYTADTNNNDSGSYHIFKNTNFQTMTISKDVTQINNTLWMGSRVQNCLISLWGDASPSSTNYFGFGINGGLLRYQVNLGSSHVFYAGTNELAKITGAGTIHCKNMNVVETISTSNIGIGMSTTPAYTLDLKGNMRVDGNVGIATNPTAFKLDVAGPTSVTSLQTNLMYSTFGALNIASEYQIIYQSDTNANNWGAEHIFKNANIESMRITQTGVGIGTIPGVALQIARDVSLGSGHPGDGGLGQFYICGASDLNKRLVFLYDTTTNKSYIQSMIQNTGTTPLCLNSHGGNVGIGTSSPEYKLDVAGLTRVQNVLWMNNQVKNCMICLWGYSSSDATNYIGFGVDYGVLRYQTDTVGTDHVFYQNNVELMRIKGTGNVGIGTSTPAYKLDVKNGDINTEGIRIESTLTLYKYLGNIILNATTSVVIQAGGIPCLIIAKSQFDNRPILQSTNALLQVRRVEAEESSITTMQCVTLSANGLFFENKFVNNTWLTSSEGQIRLYFEGVAQGGTTYIGAGAGGWQFQNPTYGNVCKISQVGNIECNTITLPINKSFGWWGGGSPSIYGYTLTAIDNGNSSDWGWHFRWGTFNKAYISRNNGEYYSASDSRLKNKIADVDPSQALDQILQLKPLKFAWKDDEDQTVNTGFFAQDVAEIIPEAVTGEDVLMLTQTKLIPYLVGAIQALSERVAILEKNKST